ncbi:MAG TPA: diguanylate cyclase [Gemmatimonadaceae bacterium]|nr:diguanylate cyclase [Gemmatimonadaceae bacterium]
MARISHLVRVPRLDSIRNKILALAVVGTLLPASASLGIAYLQNRRAREEKVAQELLSDATQTARAVGVWLKERQLDLRVFASSDEVSGNLEYRASQLAGSRLREYLASLHGRFSDFEQLFVLDLGGRVLASTTTRRMATKLPKGWQDALRTDGQLVGAAYWDEGARKGKLIIATPVRHGDGRIVGAFAAELSLLPIEALLRSFAPDSMTVLQLTDDSGALVASSAGTSPALMRTKVSKATLERLFTQDRAAASQVLLAGRDVLATLDRVPQGRWAVIAYIPATVAYREVNSFGKVALLAVVALLLVVATSAYRLGLLIVRPLERLADGAVEVARGDLAVDLPATGSGEVQDLTKIFNQMVERLRVGRQEIEFINGVLRRKNEELQRLSVTDGLTGLANHRLLMQRLTEEGYRHKRSEHPFSVLMADVDDFKKYNDEFGHPAGDYVLKAVADVLRHVTREVDCVARYGGEEFVIVMPETTAVDAAVAAERIRARLGEQEFSGQRITLSIGVAEFPKDAQSAQAMISAADSALYEAKRAGRNQVVLARPITRLKAGRA